MNGCFSLAANVADSIFLEEDKESENVSLKSILNISGRVWYTRSLCKKHTMDGYIEVFYYFKFNFITFLTMFGKIL